MGLCRPTLSCLCQQAQGPALLYEILRLGFSARSLI